MRDLSRDDFDRVGEDVRLERKDLDRPSEPRWGILVVDDEFLIRSVLERCLTYSGFNVWLAASGGEAIEVYGQHHEAITVVLLDVCMPGLDGPETLDALQQMDSGVLACFMTGDPGGHDLGDLRRKAQHVFAKPFRLAELVSRLSQVARRRPGNPPPPG